MIQIIAKVDEILSHILNMNWLYHFNYNWKVWLMWFHKKHMDKFFIQTNTSVLKNKKNCWKITFIWKMTRIMLDAFVSKFISYVYQNSRWNQRKIVPKIYPKKKTFSCLKQPPIVCFHLVPWLFKLMPFF
jgi:hypothetical protein